ncbi:hypothetical protein AGLY_002377 [Aphis glycines]|uniref:Tc1-like transposase DDE domain-containing protein n=1 Tax=Aphis glycines TaxID=307491 RepID=A0A6G0U3P3_APHGL|nr:hypothetical protein AGLY_002377 [Aphis glycines]
MSLNNSDIRSQSKQIVYNVYKFLKELSSKPDVTADFFKQAQIRTGEACGLSERTVRRICSEAKNSEDKPDESKSVLSFKSPRKDYKRAKIVSELDDFDSDVVRRTVHEFYDRGEYPTANLILNDLKQKINYSGCLRSVRNLLKNLKFSYKKCNDGRKFLMERNDIVALRCKFLREICTLRKVKDDRPIVYIDETWVNQNHSRSLIWQNERSTEGLKVPTGKGGRLIVCHAGCARYGFIQGSKLVFRSNTGNTADYHSQMNAEIFQKWFIELLNNLEEPNGQCVISLQVGRKYPKSNWKKADVQKWLTEKYIEFNPFETIPELHQKIKALIPRGKQYLLDQIALENGHEVIRLPPYHCQYNPIELIWAQVKSQVAKKNNTFKMVDIERLTHEALDAVTKRDWEKCVRHAEQLQELDNQKEILRDALMEPIILTILPDDSDASDEESDAEELE